MKKIKTILIFILAFILLIPIQTFAAEQKPSTTYNFYFKNVINTSGQYIEQIKVGSSKISEGTSGSKAEKWFVNFINGKLLYTGTYQNVTYDFNGQFLDSDKNPITFPIEIKYIENTPIIDIYIYPQYDATPLSFLHFNYIDNISTGSGSWANQGSTTNYNHTFKEPDPQEGYQFITWKDFEAEKEYTPGGVYSCDISTLQSGETKEVNIYAVWQPSLTVNWYDGENLLNSQEIFTDSIQAYSIDPIEKNNMNFIGWADTEGNIIDEDTVYSVPKETIEKVERDIINLYTVYEEIPQPEPDPQPTPEPEKPDPQPTPEPQPTPKPQPTPVPEKPKPQPTPKPDFEPDPEPEKQPESVPSPEPARETVIIYKEQTKANENAAAPSKAENNEPKVAVDPTPATPETVKEQVIEEADVPLAKSQPTRYWALVNLILTILSIGISIILSLLLLFTKQDKDQYILVQTYEERRRQRSKVVKRLISIIITISIMFIFLLTEDITLPMQYTDKYTLLMLIIFIIHILIAIIWRHLPIKHNNTTEGEN